MHRTLFLLLQEEIDDIDIVIYRYKSADKGCFSKNLLLLIRNSLSELSVQMLVQVFDAYGVTCGPQSFSSYPMDSSPKVRVYLYSETT